jgi:hypothetical protein
MSTRTLTILLLTLASIGCGGGKDTPTGPEDTSTGIRIVAGANIADTVGTRPLQALVVEVREGGKSTPGVVVRFETLPATDSTRRYEVPILTSKIAQNFFSNFASDTTNASGRASALVQLGTIAGEARLLVSAPELGLSDTVSFTVRPGLAAKLVMTVRDTVVGFGRSYVIGAAVADRYNNPRSDAVTFTSASPLATVDATGKVQAGQETGRGLVVLSSGSATDTARFTVIPLVNITYMYGAPSGATWIAESQLDGSSVRNRLQTSSPAYPSPSPTSQAIAFQRAFDSYDRIFVVDGAGAERDLLQGSGIVGAYYPRFSGDGTYIYFGAFDNTGYAVWRVHPDGSGLSRVVGTNFGFTSPGVSPDGSRIAYSDDALYVLTVATGAKVKVGETGWFPVFSPDGQRLAYFGNSGIVLANGDETSARPLGIGVQADAGLAWLPDSKWLITRDCCSPILVNASTGEVLPLRSIASYYQIAVRP